MVNGTRYHQPQGVAGIFGEIRTSRINMTTVRKSANESSTFRLAPHDRLFAARMGPITIEISIACPLTQPP
jgi:hypothetical protein